MRVCCLILVVLAGACTSSLRLGDRAFSEGDWEAASRAWDDKHPEDDDEATFRRALLAMVPDTPFYDRDRSRALLEELVQRSPRSPFGFAASRMLERRRQREALEARVRDVEEQLARLADLAWEEAAIRADAARTQRAAMQRLEEESQRLRDELRLTREAHAAELQALQDESSRLQAEIEEMKQIDLRD